MSSKRKQTFYTQEYREKRWLPQFQPNELKQIVETDGRVETFPFDKDFGGLSGSSSSSYSSDSSDSSSSSSLLCQIISSKEASELDSFPFMTVIDDNYVPNDITLNGFSIMNITRTKIEEIFKKLIELMRKGVIMKFISDKRSVFCNAHSNLLDTKFRYVLIVNFSFFPELFMVRHTNNKTQYLRDNGVNMNNWDSIAGFAQKEILSRPIKYYTL